MIVSNLNVFGASRSPTEADAKLIVHADAVLSGAVAL
jgi:hypothetical protein